MSFLTDNDTPQQNSTGPSWDPTGQLTDVRDLEDSRINRSSFYQDVFRPAWKSLEDAAATLFLEWFSGLLNTIGQLASRYNNRQAEKQQRFPQMRTNHQWRIQQEPQPIPLETPIGLRKVIGETHKPDTPERFLEKKTGEQAERKSTNAVKTLPKANPWLEATRKQQCVLEIKPPQAKNPARKMAKPRKQKFEDEPNRGLDDIYTRPVKDLFQQLQEEEKDFSFKKPAPQPASTPRKIGLPALGTQTIAELIDAELEHALSPALNTGLDSDHSSRAKQPENTLPKREFHEYELIPGLSPSPVDAATVLQAELDRCPAENATQENRLPVSATQQPNRHGASILLAKARSAKLEFKRQMPQYQEVKHEMTGADHMARNNRILHNSISNLADAYFKRAAEEEQREYY